MDLVFLTVDSSNTHAFFL